MRYYYIIPQPQSDMSQFYDKAVGDAETCVKFDNKVVIKLPEGDEGDYPMLNGFTRYDEEEIKAELQGTSLTIDPLDEV